MIYFSFFLPYLPTPLKSWHVRTEWYLFPSEPWKLMWDGQKDRLAGLPPAPVQAKQLHFYLLEFLISFALKKGF